MKKMMKMKHRIVLYRWMLAAWLLVGHALPNYAQTGGSRTTSSRDQWAMTNMQYQTANAPAYQFRSTSPYSTMVNNTSTVGMSSQAPSRPYSSLVSPTSTVGAPAYAPSGPRRGPWDPPEDNPIGVLPDPAPLGEPLILLLMAALFILFKKKRVTSK